MTLSKFERMLQLADEAFEYRSDPGQISVDEEQRERLEQIHPATLSEYNEGDGPIAWVMVIPTRAAIMQQFINHEITELQLLQLTQPGDDYDTIYLCSAMVLEEYRRKGIAMQLTLKAIADIRKEHNMQTLFVWPFSEGGDSLSMLIAEQLGLPLLKRVDNK